MSKPIKLIILTILTGYALLTISCKESKNVLVEQLNENSEVIHLQVKGLRYSLDKLDVLEDSHRFKVMPLIEELRNKTEHFYSKCDSFIRSALNDFNSR